MARTAAFLYQSFYIRATAITSPTSIRLGRQSCLHQHGYASHIGLARTLVGNPDIIIFDDSASALDYATDARLRAAVKQMEGKHTVFIVSQRAASISHADKIIVLDDGHAVGIGTHEQLLMNCPVYQEIYYSQFPKEDSAQ